MMNIFTIIVIVGGCVCVAILFLFFCLLLRNCGHTDEADIERYNLKTDNLTIVEPNVQYEGERRRAHIQPLMPIKSAVRKHIQPHCNSAAEAVKFSVERNRGDPTEMNTVFRVQPTEFHLKLLNGEEVKVN